MLVVSIVTPSTPKGTPSRIEARQLNKHLTNVDQGLKYSLMLPLGNLLD